MLNHLQPTYILTWALHRGDHKIYATKRTIYLLNSGAKISTEETCIVVREEHKVSGSQTYQYATYICATKAFVQMLDSELPPKCPQ
jgi:hypothetical protein